VKKNIYINKMINVEDSDETTRVRKRRKLSEDEVELAPEVHDIPSLIEIAQRKVRYQNLDSATLWKILPELVKLNSMIGMHELKHTLFYQIIYYLQNMHKKGENDYLHTVITGPPGTGKTSVAEIIGKIYKNIGVLSNTGSFTIAKREDFIAPYLGQTAIKTRVLLDSCIGGVLFIDEAYALGPGQKDKDSFSKEAIDTLNAFLSEHKNDFQWVHKIAHYNENELAQIMKKMIKEAGWEINVSISNLAEFIKTNSINFKNYGGDIETFFSKCKMAHARRVFALEQRHRFVLTITDLQTALELTNANNLATVQEKPPFGMYL